MPSPHAWNIRCTHASAPKVLTFGDTGHLTVDRPEYTQQVEAFDWQRTQEPAAVVLFLAHGKARRCLA